MTKITDDELMLAIWKNQLRRLATGVLHHYIGGEYGLVNDDRYWYLAASSEHILNRHRVTDVVTKMHLRKRIVDLIQKGRVHSPYGEDVLTFCVDCGDAKRAFEDARDFWLSKGVPQGMTDGKCNTAKIDRFCELVKECQDMLEDKYGQSASYEEQ